MALKKTPLTNNSHLKQGNVEHYTFGENRGRKDLILTKSPKDVKLSPVRHVVFLEGVISKLKVKI